MALTLFMFYYAIDVSPRWQDKNTMPMKPRFLILLSAIAILLPEKLSATFTNEYDGDIFRYEIIDNTSKTCRLVSYEPIHFGAPLIIPEFATDGINSYLVTEIGNRACERCACEYIEIPSSIISIGDEAFLFCGGNGTLIIPNSVKSIGYNCFAECNFSEVILSNSIKEISGGAFRCNYSLSSL